MEREQMQELARLLLNEIEPDLLTAGNLFELEKIAQIKFKDLYLETMKLHLNPKGTTDQRKKKRHDGMGHCSGK
jgi:hypothetical protein